ncbi:MAG: transglutaminase-like domain-containing protein [Fibrobacter sp.]|jgi:transglutaminase-like putative cysteine protease|nr:transglutaminase-like domain-containing protein [Fibrobacter sp.]
MNRSTLLLVLLSIACVWNQSRVHLLAFLSVFAAFFIYRKVKQNKTVVLKKFLLYLGVIPFALWWTFSPEVESGISPWLFFIPAWFFIFLSLMQWRSLKRGGYLVFVQWNALSACIVSLKSFDRVSIILALAAFAVFLWSVRAPGSPIRWGINFAVFLAVTALLGAGTLGFRHVYRGSSPQKNWGEDYYEKRNLTGFNAVSQLGSFESNFLSKYNEQVVLRLWTKKAPYYMRAIAYERYIPGIGLWKKPDAAQMLYPGVYYLNYATFGSDSLPEGEPVWVQSALNQEFLFLPAGASLTAVQADSLALYTGGAISNPRQKDWFYWDRGTPIQNETADSLIWLQIPDKLGEFLTGVSSEMGLDSLENPALIAKTIKNYLQKNFEYSLTLPMKKGRNRDEPLYTFWNYKKGYCDYYATLAALLLRYRGVEARYVNGFAQPEILGDYAVFRRKHAHTWVEYKDSSKWIIFDPTPAIDRELEITGFWNRNQEQLNAKIAYLFHQLKEGAWRKKVDEWQVYTERVTSSRAFIPVLLMILATLSGVRLALGRKRRKKQTIAFSEHIRRLQAKLNLAERGLVRLGFKRETGETAGHFLSRLPPETEIPEKKRRIYREYLKNIREYEASRWTF